MNHIEQAIKEAVEKGGYYFFPGLLNEKIQDYHHPQIFLDPLFWQALGKVRGWGAGRDFAVGTGTPEYSDWITGHSWGWYWHRFIDHLAENKSAESFFATLV